MARIGRFAALKKINLFSNRYAYWFLALHVIAILGILIVGLIPAAFDVTLQALPLVLTLYLPFLGLQLVWLTFTKKWGHFLKWFVTRWAENLPHSHRGLSNVKLPIRMIAM